MATRNERRKRAKERMLDKLSMRLVREEARQQGIVRDNVTAIVKRNLASGCKLSDEERAWLGKGCSNAYNGEGAIGAMRYGTGHTISVAKGPIKMGRLRGRGADWTD